MPDTTIRRPTIHPPTPNGGAHTLVWTCEIDPDALEQESGALLEDLVQRFRDEVGAVLDRHDTDRALREFMSRCRFSLKDLRARDNRAGVAAARRELAWHLHKAGWTHGRIGKLLDRHRTTVINAVQQHEADLQVGRWRNRGAA